MYVDFVWENLSNLEKDSGLDLEFVISKLKNYAKMLEDDINNNKVGPEGTTPNPEQQPQPQRPQLNNEIVD